MIFVLTLCPSGVSGFSLKLAEIMTVTKRNDLPDGNYGFIEMYCDEPNCDCRRVMVLVLRPETGTNKPWATINYGWESEGFYQK